MRISRTLIVNLVAILLLGIITVGWVVTQIVGGGALNSPMTVTADFATSGGVFTNQEVTYRGVLIGKVGDLALNDDGVTIKLLIDPEWDGKIPADVTATVQSKSAVGEQFVNLTPNSDRGPMLEDGDAIAREDTHLPVDFQQLLSSLDAVLSDVPPGKTRRLIQNLAGGIGGREEEIATILRSLGTLSDAFASVADEQKRLLTNATTVGSDFLRTKDELAIALRAADDVLRGIGDEPEELANLFRQNDRFARSGIALLNSHGRDLANGIRSLADLVDFQLREKESVIQSLDYVPDFLHAVEDASVPWVSPDGSRFYRIRIGVVADNVPSSWPCKYRRNEDYHRFPHEREPRPVNTNLKCLPQETGGSGAASASLVAALREWADEHPAEVDPVTIDTTSLDPDAPVSHEGFIWPLQGLVTSGFGMRDGHMHTGIDIDGQTGDAVAAAASGNVLVAGPYYGYGNTVIIDHGNGIATLYGHLSAVAVAPGDRAEQGQVIGAVGCTGTCTGDHLHFEVRVDGVPVDPLPYLPGGPFFIGVSPGVTTPL